MGWLFSKPAPPPPDEPSEKDKFQLKLKVSRDRLEKYIAKTDKELAVFDAQARELLKAGKREDARRVLQIKKMKMNALDVAHAGRLKLEHLNHELDLKGVQEDVLEGLAAGTRALETVNNAMPLSRVQAILDSADDALAQQAEVQEVLLASKLYGEEDTSQVEADLAELDAHLAAGGVATSGAAAAPAPAPAALDVGAMPVAPSHAVEDVRSPAAPAQASLPALPVAQPA